MGRAALMIIGGIFMLLVFPAPVGNFMGITAIGIGTCWLLWLMLVGNSNLSKGGDWVKKYPDSKYKFAYGEYGIAVSENQLHLCEYGYTKSYAFNDVRSWKTNLSTGGNIIGGGNIGQLIDVGIANRKQQKSNEQNTGLFVTVRDVDKPVWRIKFSDNEEEEKTQQARWFEILNQTLNENVRASVEPQSLEALEPHAPSTLPLRGLYRFCQSCGVKNGREASFCEGCGTPMAKINV